MPEMTVSRALYPISEVVRDLSLSRSTVNRMILAGTLHRVRVGPGSVRITRESLHAYLKTVH